MTTQSTRPRRLLRQITIVAFIGWCAAACQSTPEPPAPAALKDDLVVTARAWRKSQGMPAARNLLADALTECDAGKGMLEHRVLRTNGDKSITYPDSLASLPAPRREQTAIFLVLGFHTKARRSEPVIRQVEVFLRQQNWHAVLVPIPEHGTPDEDAAAIQKSLEDELPKVRRAIIIGFSKGSLDWMHWFSKYAEKLPDAQRNKIRLMISFAGALRGAAVADWMAHGRGLVPAVLRARVNSQTDKALAVMTSTAGDPWRNGTAPDLGKEFPRLQAINIVASPDGKDGYTEVDGKFRLLSKLSTSQWPWLGPVDGLVETAGQVLPAESGVPQHIVRIRGSHAVLDGFYPNGSVVSKIYRQGGENYWMGGEELLDDMMRAIPSGLVWD